jgi:hypothetical protein
VLFLSQQPINLFGNLQELLRVLLNSRLLAQFHPTIVIVHNDGLEFICLYHTGMAMSVQRVVGQIPITIYIRPRPRIFSHFYQTSSQLFRLYVQLYRGDV